MLIKIYPPLCFSEKGRRANNQDSIYPPAGLAAPENRVFLVCDGVGGAAAGEVASRVAADSIGQFFENQSADVDHIEQAFDHAQLAIDARLQTEPHSKGMGTTATFLQLNQWGASIAHVGDSRVYHIRGGHILFCTEDHSLINEMRKKGMENLEGVRSNVITRAVQGHSVRSVKADVQFIGDVTAADYFLLCSDGVWGVFTDDELSELFSSPTSATEKMDVMETKCKAASGDNYSAYLIQIESVSVENDAPGNGIAAPDMKNTSSMNGAFNASKNGHTPPAEETPTEIMESPAFTVPRIQIEDAQKPRKAGWVIPVIILFIIAAIIAGAYFLVYGSKK